MFSNDIAIGGLALPFELIVTIDSFTVLKTHTRLRATCEYFRQFLPVQKVVNFDTLKELVEEYGIRGWKYHERERNRYFQQQVHLQLDDHDLQSSGAKSLIVEKLTQDQFEFLCYQWGLFYEVCRVSKIILDHPEHYSHINLASWDSYPIIAAASIGDVALMKRLLRVPKMDPSTDNNWAMEYAALFGQLESVRFLLQDPRVDPSDWDNQALKMAAGEGYSEICLLLLTDLRVLALYRDFPIQLPEGVCVKPFDVDGIHNS